ncbi:TPA: hypothetical protein SLE31_003407 [Citrobacter freundii]|nr:hypothetical protein [Citrobacter freundii]
MIRFSMDHDICVSGSLWVRRSSFYNKDHADISTDDVVALGMVYQF